MTDIQDTVTQHDKWIADHQKKSTRHTIYFGLVVAYVAFDILCRFL
jgi:hypothetical protein